MRTQREEGRGKHAEERAAEQDGMEGTDGGAGAGAASSGGGGAGCGRSRVHMSLQPGQFVADFEKTIESMGVHRICSAYEASVSAWLFRCGGAGVGDGHTL
jgi:hypothetical protein